MCTLLLDVEAQGQTIISFRLMLRAASHRVKPTSKLIEPKDVKRFASDSQIPVLVNADDTVAVEYLTSRYGQLLRGVDRMRNSIKRLRRLDQRVTESGSGLVAFLLHMVNLVRDLQTFQGEGQVLLNSSRTDEAVASTTAILRLCEQALVKEEKREHASRRPPAQVVREELTRMASDFERMLRLEEVELEDVTGELEEYLGAPLTESFKDSARVESLRTDNIQNRRQPARSPNSSPSVSSPHSVSESVSSDLGQSRSSSPPPYLRRRSRSFPAINPSSGKGEWQT